MLMNEVFWWLSAILLVWQTADLNNVVVLHHHRGSMHGKISSDAVNS